MKKSGKDRLKCVVYESTRAPLRGPPSPMGKATIREQRYPHIVRANTCMCEKTIPPTKPSPRGEGGERSEPDRVLATRKISGKIVSSRQFTRAPKEANPASLRSAAPSKGRGSRGHSLLPMEGGAPKGRRLDGESGMKKSGKIVSSASFTRAPYPPLRGPPFPKGESYDMRMRLFSHRQSEYRIRGEKE